MPKISVDVAELDLLGRDLRAVGRRADGVAKRALFQGARVAADALRQSVDSLERVTDAQVINSWKKGVPTVLSVSQKNGLRDSLGISPFKTKDGAVRTSVGFSGYNDIKTKRWPNGQPNIMVAASCEHGSSAMLEQPFIRPTYLHSSTAIQRAMWEGATQKITEIMEET